MIGVVDVAEIVRKAAGMLQASTSAQVAGGDASADPAARVERVRATRDPASAWVYDPIGYFLVLVDRPNRRLRVEQYTPEHRLVRVIEGAGADEICHTIVRLEQVTLLGHAAYLGRELARAETALRLDLDYEQDRPISGRAALDASTDRQR
jgi:tetrahydromethanopterin S-methyltransferase subunit A